MANRILEAIEKYLNLETLNAEDRVLVAQNIESLKRQKLNIMFVGATGVGKSSTINAIFNTEIAKVGYSTDPETSTIQKFELDNMVLWDSPGLGDSPSKDQKYALEISNALKAKDANGELLIDEVVVVVDGSNRDMRTGFEIIENILLPYIGDTSRLIVAINQCDVALKGRYWNHESGAPEPQLIDFLDAKVASIEKRIKESTGVHVEPMYYSALEHYNISKLLLTMLRNMPESKRFLCADSLNSNPQIWTKNDELEQYNKAIRKEVEDSLSKAIKGAANGAIAGAQIGKLIPVVGPVVGAVVGGVLGFLGGLFS